MILPVYLFSQLCFWSFVVEYLFILRWLLRLRCPFIPGIHCHYLYATFGFYFGLSLIINLLLTFLVYYSVH